MAWSPDGGIIAAGCGDGSVLFWKPENVPLDHHIAVHSGPVRTITWSPDGSALASGSDDGTLRLWDASSGQSHVIHPSHRRAVTVVSWSPNGETLASSSFDQTIRLRFGHEKIFEGHEVPIIGLAWSPDSKLIASVGNDGEVRLWDTESGQSITRPERLPFGQTPVGIHFGSLGEGWETSELKIALWRPAPFPVANRTQVLQASAKVVLAGDSNSGKTCLARRLVENRFESDQSSTHGMQIWTLAPEKLHPDAKAPAGQSREIFLWDLGGQEEYQLVNQLFLNDTSIALVLFDATRGTVGLESANIWNQRLQTNSNANLRRFLIRSKADQPGLVSSA
ncbi:MAG: 50S ribosome-binding GTPase, partial [Acidobacteriaceae bacterium]|nr:50S ribosome-binding GTPase [Acidobacteriaceae bacterium]